MSARRPSRRRQRRPFDLLDEGLAFDEGGLEGGVEDHAGEGVVDQRDPLASHDRGRSRVAADRDEHRPAAVVPAADRDPHAQILAGTARVGPTIRCRAPSTSA